MVKLDSFLIALIALLFSFVDIPVSCAFDYFAAAEEGQASYLELVTKHHAEKADVWIRENRIGNAIEDLKYTLDRFPNHPLGLQLMGLVSKITKNPSMAIPYYQKALSLYPQYAVTHAQYGQYLLSNGDIDGAIESLKRSIEVNPKLVFSYVLLARAHAKKGNAELANEAAARARELGYNGPLSDIGGGK